MIDPIEINRLAEIQVRSIKDKPGQILAILKLLALKFSFDHFRLYIYGDYPVDFTDKYGGLITVLYPRIQLLAAVLVYSQLFAKSPQFTQEPLLQAIIEENHRQAMEANAAFGFRLPSSLDMWGNENVVAEANENLSNRKTAEEAFLLAEALMASELASEHEEGVGYADYIGIEPIFQSCDRSGNLARINILTAMVLDPEKFNL